MSKYDVTDTAILTARPEAVYRAFVAEMDGKTTWWAPHHTFRLISGDSFASIGALLESTVQTKWPVKYTTKTTAVEFGKSISVQYVGGSFRGEALWTFATQGDGTQISCRWQTTPAGSLRLVAPFLPVEKSHSHVTHAGYENLEEYLRRASEP